LGLTALGFGLWGVISGEKVFEKDWFPTLSDKTLQDSLRENIRHAFTWLIIGACLLVGIAFLGFCGGCKENKCLLGTFFAILFVLTLVFLAALILFFAFPKLIKSGVDKLMEKERENYSSDKVRQNVDWMQKNFTCCLFNKTVAEEKNITSCFSGWDNADEPKPADAKFHTKKCSSAVVEKIKGYLHQKQAAFAVMVSIIIVVCVIQMILSLYVCCKLKNGSSSYDQMS